MSQIRIIYHPVDGKPQQPNFPATDQHPDAVRYLVGEYYVDAIGGEPTQKEIATVLNPPAPKSEASSMVEKIAADPAALAALKAELNG